VSVTDPNDGGVRGFCGSRDILGSLPLLPLLPLLPTVLKGFSHFFSAGGPWGLQPTNRRTTAVDLWLTYRLEFITYIFIVKVHRKGTDEPTVKQLDPGGLPEMKSRGLVFSLKSTGLLFL
jgi:hypothetical protein